MRLPRGRKLALVSALALTLALTIPFKILVFDKTVQIGFENLPNALQAFLARHHFETSTELGPGGYVITGISGTCRLRIREVVDWGFNLDAIKLLFHGSARLVFIVDGEIYSDYPRYLALMYKFKFFVLQKLGWHIARYPALSVAASEGCPIETLPWHEIAF
jgi:hypothetical protein